MPKADDFLPVPIDQGSGGKRQRVRPISLIIIALIGALLIVWGVFTASFRPDVNQVWWSLEIDLGISVLLFAVLFWVEHRIVTREIDPLRQLIEDVTPERMAQFATESPDDFQRLEEQSSPVDAALTWVERVLSNDFGTAWQLSEENWRYCRIQAWVYNNMAKLELHDLDNAEKLAKTLLHERKPSDIWDAFESIELRDLRKSLKPMKVGDLGSASRRRCVGPGYEVVIVVPMGGRNRGYIVNAPAMLPRSATLLMHKTDETWTLAAYRASAPPSPGWPPAWWSEGDPVAERATEDMEPSE